MGLSLMEEGLRNSLHLSIVCVCMYVVCAYAYTDTSECLHTVHHARLIDRGRELKEKFHSVVVEAQTYLAKLIIAYIRRYCNTCTSVG